MSELPPEIERCIFCRAAVQPGAVHSCGTGFAVRCPVCRAVQGPNHRCATPAGSAPWSASPPQNDAELWNARRRMEVAGMASSIAQGLVLGHMKAAQDSGEPWSSNAASIDLIKVADDAFAIALRILTRSEDAIPRSG